MHVFFGSLIQIKKNVLFVCKTDICGRAKSKTISMKLLFKNN